MHLLAPPPGRLPFPSRSSAFFDPAIGVRLGWYQHRTPTSMKSAFSSGHRSCTRPFGCSWKLCRLSRLVFPSQSVLCGGDLVDISVDPPYATAHRFLWDLSPFPRMGTILDLMQKPLLHSPILATYRGMAGIWTQVEKRLSDQDGPANTRTTWHR